MSQLKSFDTVFTAAEQRYGGFEELLEKMPVLPSDAELIRVSDNEYLAKMVRCVFVSGFSGKVIANKWDGFLEVFHNFDVDVLVELPEEEWQAMQQDSRIVRNGRKINAVRENALLIQRVAKEHKSFGRFLVSWGAADQLGLMAYMQKNGNHLGDNTSQYFLRYAGIDGFIMSKDVCRAAAQAGVDIKPTPTSKVEKQALQDAFNAWYQETEMPYTHLSKILAYSVE